VDSADMELALKRNTIHLLKMSREKFTEQLFSPEEKVRM